MGPEYFPSLFFFWEGIILKLWLAERAYTCVHLHWPTTIKIDSDGSWWLTHCLSSEKKKVGKKQHKEKAQGLTYTHQLHARVSSNASAIRKTTWAKMGKKSTLEYIYSVRLLLKHTWLGKADTATCMLPLIILFTSLLDLKATGPLFHWVSSNKTGKTGPARQLTAFGWWYLPCSVAYSEEARTVPTLKDVISKRWLS